MEDDGCIARGEGGGGIYCVLRDCPVSKDRDPNSPKFSKLRKKDEIVVLEWCLLASPPVMRVRCAEGWCTERDMDGGLNVEHVHGRRVGQTEEEAVFAAAGTPPGRRRSVSVMSSGEKQALRRASVEIAQQQMATHMAFADGTLGGGSGGGGGAGSAGLLGRSMSARRLIIGGQLPSAGSSDPGPTTCATRSRPRSRSLRIPQSPNAAACLCLCLQRGGRAAARASPELCVTDGLDRGGEVSARWEQQIPARDDWDPSIRWGSQFRSGCRGGRAARWRPVAAERLGGL